MDPWTLKIHQESKKCWLVVVRYVWRSWWAGLFVSRTWKIINEVVSEQDTYLMKTCATVTALKHIRGDGTMSWSGNVWGVCVTDRGGWSPWQWAGAWAHLPCSPYPRYPIFQIFLRCETYKLWQRACALVPLATCTRYPIALFQHVLRYKPEYGSLWPT